MQRASGMAQYAAAFLLSILVGFAMGAGVMFHIRGPPVTVTTEVSVPYPVLQTVSLTTTVLRTTTTATTVPLTVTKTAFNTTTQVLTSPTTITFTAIKTTTLNHTTTRTETVSTTVTTTALTTTTTLSTTTVTSTVTSTAITTTTVTSTVTVRPESVICFSRTEDCASKMIGLINRANLSINVAVYVFTHPQLADALVAADRRGVRVIVVVERNSANITGSQVGYLMANGVEVILDENPYLMHHKFAIIDGLFVIVGSYNWSISAEERNDESVLIIRDPEIASRFQQEFNRILLEAEYQ